MDHPVLVHVVSICVSVHVGPLTHLSLFMVNTSVSLHKIKMMVSKETFHVDPKGEGGREGERRGMSVEGRGEVNRRGKRREGREKGGKRERREERREEREKEGKREGREERREGREVI